MIYVIDAGSVAAWKFFSDPETPDGMLNGIKEWFDRFRDVIGDNHVVVCLDSASTRRKAIDPEYKLNRSSKPKPELFVDQLKRMPALWESMGVPTLRFDGEEADDVIASVVSSFDTKSSVVVVSSDKDLMCLVDATRVVQYDPRPNKDGRNDIYDPAAVEAKLGVPPWRVVDFLSIAGDSSDGIRGIQGIGKTYALAAIRQTRSIGELFRKAKDGKLEGLKESTQKKISAGYGEYEASRKLVELRTDLEVPADPGFYRIRSVLGGGGDVPAEGGVSASGG